MSSSQSRLERLEGWLDRQNAKDEAISKARPAWWQAAKIVFGASCFARGVNLGLHADTAGAYALGALLVAAGISLMVDGATHLRERWMARDAAG